MDEAIITTSWDDGNPLDLKLAELLKKYDIPATFYIPVDNTERECMNSQQIRELARSFDIGGHSYHHEDLTKVYPKEAGREIVEGKKRLEDIIGKEVLSFSYPHGRFNAQLMNIVKEAGFIGARTVMLLTRSIKDPFKMATMIDVGHWWFTHYILHSLASRDPHLSLFMLKNNLFSKGWEKIALETLRFVVDNGGIWHLWGHSWEVEENKDWAKLEGIFHILGSLSKDIKRMDNSQLLKMCAGKV